MLTLEKDKVQREAKVVKSTIHSDSVISTWYLSVTFWPTCLAAASKS